MNTCGTCKRIQTRDRGEAAPWDAILRLAEWDVVHSYNTTLLGWLVLIPNRHVEAIDQLTDSEAQLLGTLLRDLSAFLKQYTGCTKTYVMQFAEDSEHPHVHFHIVPRMADMPQEFIATNVFGYLTDAESQRVPEAQMNALAEALRAYHHAI